MSFKLTNVRLAYADGAPVLSRIVLQAGRGERVAIIGASGAGKTSLIRMLAVARRPDDGAIEVLDRSPWRSSAADLRELRCRIGVIH